MYPKYRLELSLYFGYNPRRCFEASTSGVAFKDEIKHVRSVIRKAADSWRDIIPLLQMTLMGSSDASHTIFQNFPTDKKRLLSNCHFGPVSRWALDILLRHCKANAATKLYYYLLTIPEAAVLRGHLFEWQVLNHLCSIQTKSSFSIRGLANSEKKTWTYRGPIPRTDLKDSTVFNELTKAVEDQKSLHLVPLVRKFSAVDSVLYDPEDPEAVLTCIQITRNKYHPIDVPSLQRIQSWLRVDRQTVLEGLRPTKDRPWRFLFVVQSGMEAKFKSQNFKSKEGSDESGVVWAVKVDQHVLGFEEQTIFCKTSERSESTSQSG